MLYIKRKLKVKVLESNKVYEGKYHKDLTSDESGCAGLSIFDPLDVFIDVETGWLYKIASDIKIMEESVTMNTIEMLTAIKAGDKMKRVAGLGEKLHVEFVNGVLCWSGDRRFPFQLSLEHMADNEWELVDPRVKTDFPTAVEAFEKGGHIQCEYNGDVNTYKPIGFTSGGVMKDQSNRAVSSGEILKGTWFILPKQSVL